MSQDQSATAPSSGPGGAVPLLRILGDTNAAVCLDGYCEVPVQEAAPVDDGSHE